MDNVIRLHGDAHRQVQELLPWYANGTLAADEVATVEAHLADCAECRAELQDERALRRGIVEQPTDAQQGWEAMRARLAADHVPVRTMALSERRRSLWRRPVALGWVLTAQAAVLVLSVGVTSLLVREPVNTYRALGSAPVAAPGNLLVMFRPDTSEAALRTVLEHVDARLVDGPTSANAYVLRVAADRRDAALAGLRADPDIVLAEPIDAGDGR